MMEIIKVAPDVLCVLLGLVVIGSAVAGARTGEIRLSALDYAFLTMLSLCIAAIVYHNIATTV